MGDKVEKWKLSPELISWLKTYKSFKGLEAVARASLLNKRSEMMDIGKIWTAIAQTTQGLRDKFPRTPLRKIQGMETTSTDEDQGQKRMISY